MIAAEQGRPVDEICREAAALEPDSPIFRDLYLSDPFPFCSAP